MTTKQRKTLVIIIAVMLLTLAVVAWLIWQQFAPEEPTFTNRNVNEETNVNVVVVKANINTETPPINEETVEKLEMRRIANLFTERFGSYSSEANFQNILDLKDYMTGKMWTWADNYVKKQRIIQAGDKTYFGITTKVLSTTINNQTESKAELLIITQRKETKEDGTIKTYTQDIILQMRKIENDWKVDEATWQDVSS